MLSHHLRFLGARALTMALAVAVASAVYAPAASAQAGADAIAVSPQDSAKAAAEEQARWEARDADLAKARTFADTTGIFLKYGMVQFAGGGAPGWTFPEYELSDLLGANPTPLILGDSGRVALDQIATVKKGNWSADVIFGGQIKKRAAEWKALCPSCTDADADHGVIIFSTKK